MANNEEEEERDNNALNAENQNNLLAEASDSQLPSYDRATGATNNASLNVVELSDPPPSYDSLPQRLRLARTNSSNPYEYVSNVSHVFCSSVPVVITYSILTAFSLALLIVGSIYINKCPIDSKIPIWLIVTGSIGCFQILLRLFAKILVYLRKRSNPNYKTKCRCCITCLIIMFLFVWFICGNVWIYQVRSVVSFDDYNLVNVNNNNKYCDKACYLFSFWIITILWILFSFNCCCCCALIFLCK